MTFDYLFLLNFLFIFIPIILYDVFAGSRKIKYKLPEHLKKKTYASAIFFRIFIAFSIIALAGPRWGKETVVSDNRRGLDVVFAIDVSRSMDIMDAAMQSGAVMSRLERGLLIANESTPEIVVESTAAARGVRMAAVIGRSRGYLAVPLAYNNEAVINFLESLDVSSMSGRSTNLEALVETAANVFQSTSMARKIIVLISDGESHFGILRNALNHCVRNGIIITSVAVGSDEGRPVYEEENSPQTPAVSRRNAAVMRMAAERTGGIYIDGSRDDASSMLSEYLLSFTRETGHGSGKNESKQRRTLFIVLAIFAFGISKFLPRLPSGRLPLVSMLAVVLIFSSCRGGKLQLLEANYLYSRGRYEEAINSFLKAKEYEEASPYAEYGLGLTLHSLEEGMAALNRYGNSQKLLGTHSEKEHSELRYRNYYNSGIIYFEEGDYHSAAAAFKEALREDPKKVDAKRNLEISLMSITMEAKRETRTETRTETREILFDYIKQHEQQQWKSREWAPEEQFIGPDY